MRIETAKSIPWKMFSCASNPRRLHSSEVRARPGDHLGRTRAVTPPRQGVVDSLSVGQEWLKLPSFFGNNYRGVPWFDGTMALGYSEMRMVDWIAHIDLEELPI